MLASSLWPHLKRTPALSAQASRKRRDWEAAHWMYGTGATGFGGCEHTGLDGSGNPQRVAGGQSGPEPPWAGRSWAPYTGASEVPPWQAVYGPHHDPARGAFWMPAESVDLSLWNVSGA